MKKYISAAVSLILIATFGCKKLATDRALQVILLYHGRTAPQIQTHLYRHYLSSLGGWRSDWVATGISDSSGQLRFLGLPKAIYYVEASGTSTVTGELVKGNALVYLNEANQSIAQTVSLTR